MTPDFFTMNMATLLLVTLSPCLITDFLLRWTRLFWIHQNCTVPNSHSAATLLGDLEEMRVLSACSFFPSKHWNGTNPGASSRNNSGRTVPDCLVPWPTPQPTTRVFRNFFAGNCSFIKHLRPPIATASKKKNEFTLCSTKLFREWFPMVDLSLTSSPRNVAAVRFKVWTGETLMASQMP